jgi:hypothetical protein
LISPKARRRLGFGEHFGDGDGRGTVGERGSLDALFVRCSPRTMMT